MARRRVEKGNRALEWFFPSVMMRRRSLPVVLVIKINRPARYWPSGIASVASTLMRLKGGFFGVFERLVKFFTKLLAALFRSWILKLWQSSTSPAKSLIPAKSA